MSSSPLAEIEEDVFDLTEVVPETERLDSSLQKAKAQLSIKTRRHRPSRSRLQDSLSSTEGEDGLDGKSHSGLLSTSSSPLHSFLRCPSPFSDLHPFSPSSLAQRDQSFSFDPCLGSAESEKNEQRQSSALLLNSSFSPALLDQGDLLHQGDPSDPPNLCQDDRNRHHLCQGDLLPQEDRREPAQGNPVHLRQEDRHHKDDHKLEHQQDQKGVPRNSPVHLHPEKHVHPSKKDGTQVPQGNHSLQRQRDHSHSEDESHDLGSDEPSSPTVLLDRKTRRRFLDLGVTLRRTYGRMRTERANRHSALSREPENSEVRTSRTSVPQFVPFSWFAERLRGAGSPKSSSQSQAKTLSEGEELKNDRSINYETSQPYQSLSDHSDEGCDSPPEPRFGRKKPLLPFSSGGRDRTEKQNGIQRDNNGHDGDNQKLLTTRSRGKDY